MVVVSVEDGLRADRCNRTPASRGSRQFSPLITTGFARSLKDKCSSLDRPAGAMDRTADFRELVRSINPSALHGSSADDRRDGESKVNQADVFLREAYKLLHRLQDVSRYFDQIRRPYLAASAVDAAAAGAKHTSRSLRRGGTVDKPADGVHRLTHAERDEVDVQLRSSIEDARRRVRELETVEAVRRRAVANAPLLRKLLRDADAERASALLGTHRASVTWYLNRRLLHLATRHAEARQLRVQREEERRAARIGASRPATNEPVYAYGRRSNSHGAGATKTNGDARDGGANDGLIDAAAVAETLLSPAQLQQLELEQRDMLADMDRELSSVRSAQSKLVEIAELSTELQAHLADQAALTDRLLSDARDTTDTLAGGNKQLERAKRSGSRFTTYVVAFLLIASLILLLLDLLN